MTQLVNTFEAGTPAATVTTGNSGGASGDAFGAVVIDAGNALVFDNAAAAHGSVSAKVSTGASSGSSYVAWTSGIPGTSATLWARAYLRFTGSPGATVNVLRMLSSSNGIMGTIRINSAGTIGMLYGSGTLASTSVGTVPAGAWFRVEVMVTAGSTTGVMTCRIFWTPDGTTPDETLTISNVNTGSVNPSRLRVGVVSNLANVAAFHIDDLAVSDTDWIGPAAGGGGPTVEPADVAVEVEAAQPLGRRKTTASGAAGESEQALPVGRRKAAAPALAAETEAAGPAGARKVRAPGRAAEAETAQQFGRRKVRPLGTAVETESALPVGTPGGLPLGGAAETESARPVARVKRRALGVAVEADTAQGLGRITRHQLGAAAEAETAPALTRRRARTLAPAAETATARTLTRCHRRALGVAGETEAARLLGGAVPEVLAGSASAGDRAEPSALAGAAVAPYAAAGTTAAAEAGGSAP